MNGKINNVTELKLLQKEIGAKESEFWNRNANKYVLMGQKSQRNSNLQKTTNALNKERKALEAKKAECQKMIGNLEKAVERLTKEQTNLKTQKNSMNKEIQTLEKQLKSEKNALETQTKKAKNMRTSIEKRLKNGNGSNGGGSNGSRTINNYGNFYNKQQNELLAKRS
jgi:predicted  nucleic acid-binding Zn-ribbon protein